MSMLMSIPIMPAGHVHTVQAAGTDSSEDLQTKKLKDQVHTSAAHGRLFLFLFVKHWTFANCFV